MYALPRLLPNLHCCYCLQLRSALEEERQALLAQAEQLRLSIYDEHDYRDQAVAPPPVSSDN